MILDSLPHAAAWHNIHPLFPAAFDYLEAFDPETPDGRYEVIGGDLVAIVQRYETAPESEKAWEAHRVFADIQYIVSGTERIFFAPAEALVSKVAYNAEKDVEKYEEAADVVTSSLVMGPGQFGVFFPHDGHKPGCHVSGPDAILKVVLKVRVAA